MKKEQLNKKEIERLKKDKLKSLKGNKDILK